MCCCMTIRDFNFLALFALVCAVGVQEATGPKPHRYFQGRVAFTHMSTSMTTYSNNLITPLPRLPPTSVSSMPFFPSPPHSPHTSLVSLALETRRINNLPLNLPPTHTPQPSALPLFPSIPSLTSPLTHLTGLTHSRDSLLCRINN